MATGEERATRPVHIPDVFHDLLRSRAVAIISTIGMRGEPQPPVPAEHGARPRSPRRDPQVEPQPALRDVRDSGGVDDPTCAARDTGWLSLESAAPIPAR